MVRFAFHPPQSNHLLQTLITSKQWPGDTDVVSAYVLTSQHLTQITGFAPWCHNHASSLVSSYPPTPTIIGIIQRLYSRIRLNENHLKSRLSAYQNTGSPYSMTTIGMGKSVTKQQSLSKTCNCAGLTSVPLVLKWDIMALQLSAFPLIFVFRSQLWILQMTITGHWLSWPQDIVKVLNMRTTKTIFTGWS